MKLTFVIIAAWLVSLALSGCSTIRVQPISLLSEHPKATLYYGTAEAPRDSREVAVDELVPLLARATWTTRDPFSKGGFWLRFPNGRELFIAVGVEFFRERGVPGAFVIRPEDYAAYRKAVDEVRLPPRNARN